MYACMDVYVGVDQWEGEINLQLPISIKLAGDELVVAADQFEGPVGHSLLDERVGAEVLKGHVDCLSY